MKKSIKYLAAVLAAVTAMTAASVTASAVKLTTVDGVKYRVAADGQTGEKFTGWTKTAKGRRYYKKGILQHDRWLRMKSGKEYYLSSDGYAITGWSMITKGDCYFSFFDKNGVWDGKKYWKGYNVPDLETIFRDCDFFSGDSYQWQFNHHADKDMKPFDGIETVREIVMKDVNKKLSWDSRPSDDEAELSEDIYRGGRMIVIRSSVNRNLDLIFTKDKQGNSYLHNSFYGFGCKLTDSDAYDKIMVLLTLQG